MNNVGYRLRKVVGAVAWAGFGLSLVVHSYTYLSLPLNVSLFESRVFLGLFIGLHIGAIAVNAVNAGGLSTDEVVRGAPHWARSLMSGFRWYVFVNFLLAWLIIMLNLLVFARNGVDRPDQIQEMSNTMIRAFSGHWMYFFLLSAVYNTFYPASEKVKLKHTPEEAVQKTKGKPKRRG